MFKDRKLIIIETLRLFKSKTKLSKCDLYSCCDLYEPADIIKEIINMGVKIKSIKVDGKFYFYI